MVVGIMEIDFKIFNTRSLKDKRRVVKSLIDKTKNLFNVSISEVDNNDMINYSTVGLACVSNSSRFVESLMDKILEFYDGNYDIEIVSARKELL